MHFLLYEIRLHHVKLKTIWIFYETSVLMINQLVEFTEFDFLSNK